MTSECSVMNYAHSIERFRGTSSLVVWQDAAGFGIRPLIHDVLAKNPMRVDIVIKEKIV